MDQHEHNRADVEFHDKTAQLYEPVLLPVFGIYLERVITPLLDEVTARAPGRRAIDIGCGTGLIGLLLAQRGFTVTGVDHSPAMLEIFGEKARALGLDERISVLNHTVEDLPFEDASFDIATCNGVLHHLYDMTACLKEIRRVLVPGGLLYVSEPCTGTTTAVRLWDGGFGLVRKVWKGRTLVEVFAGREVVEQHKHAVDPHEEAPISAPDLVDTLGSFGFDCDVQYASRFAGLWRAPRWAQVAILNVLSRPWRRRNGNLLYVIARRR